jgi:hypothetical protein
MKFIGQYIQSFIARFRSDVYLEDISTGTIASGGNLGLDSNNKIVKATASSGDITSVGFMTDDAVNEARVLSGAASFDIVSVEGSGLSVTNSNTNTITIGAAKASSGTRGTASFNSSDFTVSSGGDVTANAATTSARGTASFDANNFNVSSGAVSLKLPTKRLHYVHTSAKYTGSGMTSELYIALADSDRENANELNLAIPLVAPATGVLKRVLINTQSDLSAKAWSFKLKKVPSGTIASTTTLIATITSNAGGAAHTNQVVDFVTNTTDSNVLSFESGFSTSTQFSVGDRILFSTQCTSGSGPSGSPKINYTFVFEVDDSTAY